jgi:hypothetical protein
MSLWPVHDLDPRIGDYMPKQEILGPAGELSAIRTFGVVTIIRGAKTVSIWTGTAGGAHSPARYSP